LETRSSTPRQSGAVVGHEASAKHQGWRRLNEVGVKSWWRAAFNGAARVTKRKSRSSPPAALPLCRSARTSGGTANYRSVVPQKAFVCSLRHNGKNFHSLFLRNPRASECVFSGVKREGAAQAGCKPRRPILYWNPERTRAARVSCVLPAVPRPREPVAFFQGLLPPSSPYFWLEQSLAFCVAQPGRGCVKRHAGFAMSMRDHYLTRAAEFHARSRNEYEEKARHEYENLARQYLRLAKQAERNTWADVTYEPPRRLVGSG
jgi:hypothetical protein